MRPFAFALMRTALILSLFSSHTRFFVTCVILLLGYIRATPHHHHHHHRLISQLTFVSPLLIRRHRGERCRQERTP